MKKILSIFISLATILNIGITTVSAASVWAYTPAYNGVTQERSTPFPDKASCESSAANIVNNGYTITFPCAEYTGAAATTITTDNAARNPAPVTQTGTTANHSIQGYVPLAPLPYTVAAGGQTTDMGTYLSGMIKLIIALGGALAILMAIIGGTQYVAAGISPDAKNAAKDQITNAFIGLALILSSYLILNSINPKLVAFDLTLTKINPVTLEGYTAPPQNTNQLIPQLTGVTDTTMTAAVKLQALYPNIIFTNGKRSNFDQARIMATNVVGNGGQNWIMATYGSKSPACAKLLQSYVDSTVYGTANDLTGGLYDILENNKGDCADLSKHLSGQAFDVQPTNSPTFDQVWAALQSFGATSYLNGEGGVNVWHFQF